MELTPSSPSTTLTVVDIEDTKEPKILKSSAEERHRPQPTYFVAKFGSGRRFSLAVTLLKVIIFAALVSFIFYVLYKTVFEDVLREAIGEDSSNGNKATTK